MSFRLIVSLVLAITLVSLLFAVYQVETEKRSKRGEVERRAEILAESLQETVEALREEGSQEKLHQIVENFGSRERLAGVVVYSSEGQPVLMTSDLAERLGPAIPPLDKAVLQGKSWGDFFKLGQSDMQVYAVPLHSGDHVTGALAVFHDAAYIDAQNPNMLRDTFARVIMQVFLIAGITILIIRWSMVRPIMRMAQWMKDLRAGKRVPNPDVFVGDVLKPLTQEVTHLATSLRLARASAEEEARLREAAESLWTAERLRVSLHGTLEGSRLFVVSNREPYQQFYRGDAVETLVPASGLVTAMEPILRFRWDEDRARLRRRGSLDRG